jgi:hypothetical protein
VRPKLTREQQLAHAIDKADLPPRDYRIYRALFKRADWKTGVIPARWQPRSLRDIATDTHLGVATICRSLNHLESHGWITRHRTTPGRGHATTYELLTGMDCDCITGRPEPMTGSQRTQLWRARKKASHPSVTQPEKASQIDVTTGEKASQIDVTKRLNTRHTIAGQTPNHAKEGVEREVVEGESFQAPVTDPAANWETWETGSTGAAVNPWPPARIPGVRGGPIPADTETRAALHVVVACLGPVEIVEAK